MKIGAAIRRRKSLILYGAAMALLLALLKWIEWKYLLTMYAIEIYTGLVAAIFTGVGAWLAWHLNTPGIFRKEATIQLDSSPPDPVSHDLSPREVEVLNLMAAGLSNNEIAIRLYVSLNTVKSHSSSIFSKLNVKRRTQAVRRAREMRIIS